MFQFNFDSLLEKVISLSPLKYGHSQRGNNIFVTGHMTGSCATTWNKKSCYYSFKMNIKVQNMCQTYLLIIKT